MIFYSFISPFLDAKQKGGGGRTESAFNYIIGAGGIESNHTYPYRAVDGQCKFNKNDVVAHISSYSEYNLCCAMMHTNNTIVYSYDDVNRRCHVVVFRVGIEKNVIVARSGVGVC